jgi:glycosyltransferase involved in cell wall biosynthesis
MISVVIPLYNKGPHIAKTLDSVLAQTVPPAEIIVVDDGSTDEGAEIVRGYLDRGVRLVRQDNQGVSAARNRGLHEAQSEHVAFLDADDWWMPNHIATLSRLMEAYPHAGLYSTANLILRDGLYFRVRSSYEDGWSGLVDDFFLRYSKGLSLVNSTTACVKRELLLGVGGFPNRVRRGEDIIAWCKLALDHAVAHAKIVTAVYNLDAVNRTDGVRETRPPDSLRFLASLLQEEALAEKHKSIAHLFEHIAFSTAVSSVMNGDRVGFHAIQHLVWRTGRYKVALALLPLSVTPSTVLRWARRWRHRPEKGA